MSADKAPAAKLPLAVRKNVRDGWELKKAELESQMETLVGTKWTFTADPLVIYPYAEADSYGATSLGDCIFAYFEALIWSLKSFVENHGEAGVAELNSVCAEHVVTLLPNSKFTYCGTLVANGQLQLVFHPEKLGTNISNVAQELAPALSTAPQPTGASTLSYAARHSIKTDYTTQAALLEEKVRTMLQQPTFKFVPDFEAIGAALKGNKAAREDWESNLGGFVLSYFEGFVDVLTREKFGEDELLREGLDEMCPGRVLRFKVVEKLGEGKGSNGYSEVVVEGEELVVRTTAERWGTNVHYACDKLVDIL